jgi:hypothetical protein
MYVWLVLEFHQLIIVQDNYKIVCFRHDGHGITGRRLDQQFLQDLRHPVDSLLRWHFRQAVLVNMKGAGEAFSECDFPPGSDMMGEIMSGPRAGARMEFELFSRLAVLVGFSSIRSLLTLTTA